MSAVAMFRLPYADSYTIAEQSHGQPEELHDLRLLDGKSGFVLAPFRITGTEPLLLLHPDRTHTLPLRREDCVAGRAARPAGELAEERRLYAADFAACHARLANGSLAKVVLARRSAETMAREVDAEQLFLRACRLYPRMFVALVHTERSGTWLTATPETLLEGSGGSWRTVALAGTMKLEGAALGFDDPPMPGGGADGGIAWSAKNTEEQRIVADYIEATLIPFAEEVERSRAHTARAANIVHLCTDFAFTLRRSAGIGRLLYALHPTPAVCGMPKATTMEFITACEHSPRSYYSGFMGPLAPDAHTHLYVSLRCMHVSGRHCLLYAGGGLLAGSTEEQEWAETEAKMETMRLVLGDGGQPAADNR